MRNNGLGWAVTLSMFAHVALLVVLVWRSETPDMHGAGVQAVQVELVPAVPVPSAPEPEETAEADAPPVDAPEVPEEVAEEPPAEPGAAPTVATPEIAALERGAPPGFVPVNPKIGAPTALVGGRGSAVDESAEAAEEAAAAEADSAEAAEAEPVDEAPEAEAAEVEAPELEATDVDAAEEAVEPVADEAVELVADEAPQAAEGVETDVADDAAEADAAEADVEEPAEAADGGGDEALTPPGTSAAETDEPAEVAAASHNILVSETPSSEAVAVPRPRPDPPARVARVARGAPAVSLAEALAAATEVARPDDAAIGYTEAIRSAVAPVFFALMASVPSSGTVMVDVRIGRDGSVLEAKLAQSSGHFDLDQAALRAVRRARYPALPPEIRENAVRVRIPLRAF